MDGIVKRVAVVLLLALLALLGVAACGEPPGKDDGLQTDSGQQRGDPRGDAAKEPQLYRLERVWENDEVRHQSEAHGAFAKDGWLYTGGGGPNARIAKVNIADGKVAWSVEGSQYQPSFPVSNGRIVCVGFVRIGKYGAYVGLDEETGERRWKVDDVGSSPKGSACFAGDLVFVGSYRSSRYGLYAIDWAKGEVRWKTPLPRKVWSTPVTYEDLVLVGCYDGFLYAMEQATGKIAWRLDCGGRIASNPIISGGLAFLSVDDQRAGEPYDGQTVRKNLVVIDLSAAKVLTRFRTKGFRWQHKIVADEGQVLFFDDHALFVFDVSRKTLAYEIKPPPGLFPYPILTSKHVVLAMRNLGLHGERPPNPRDPCPMAVYDRRTGAKLAAFEDGGIAVWSNVRALYVQVGDLIVSLSRPMSAYRLVTHAKFPR